VKENEIAHHPYQPAPNEFSTEGYPTQILTWEGDKIKWVPNFAILGELETLQLPEEGVEHEDCIFDLQSGSLTCYSAFFLHIDGQKYVSLVGNGWGEECGFPFNEPDFDPKHPYKHGKGQYPLLKGKAMQNFIDICNQDRVPDFKEVTTGDIHADFVLTC